MNRTKVIGLIQKMPVADDDEIFNKLADLLAKEAVAAMSRMDPQTVLAMLCGIAKPERTTAPPEPAPAPEPTPTPVAPKPEEPKPKDPDKTPVPDGKVEPAEPPDKVEELPKSGTSEWQDYKKRQRRE